MGGVVSSGACADAAADAQEKYVEREDKDKERDEGEGEGRGKEVAERAEAPRQSSLQTVRSSSVREDAVALLERSAVLPLRNSASVRLVFLESMRQDEIGTLLSIRDDSPKRDGFLRKKFSQFALSNAYTNWSHRRLRLYDYLSDVSSGFDDLILASESSDVARVQADLVEFTYACLPESRASLLERGSWFIKLLELDGLAMTWFLTSLDEEKGFPLLYANNYATKRFGFSKAELYGRPNPFLAPTGPERMQSALPSRQSVQVLAKDGAVIQGLMFTVPMFDCESEHRCNLSLVTLSVSEEAMFSVAYLLCLIPSVLS